jgi:hypothetical protein
VNAGHLAALSLPDRLRGVVAPLLPVPDASYEGFNAQLLRNHIPTRSPSAARAL